MTYVGGGVLSGVLITVLAAAVAGCSDTSRAAAPLPAPVVKVEPVVQRDVPISLEYVGSLVGYITAQIRARVSGHLMSQNYTEGSVVKTGDLLFQVDPRPFQAALDQAQAKRAEADQRRTELDVGRYTPLAQRGSVSQQELDNAVQNNLANVAAVAAARASVQNAQANVSNARAALENAQANVKTQEANIAAARASLTNAKLNLGYTRVLAPISGVAGFRVANIGDYVGPSDP